MLLCLGPRRRALIDELKTHWWRACRLQEVVNFKNITRDFSDGLCVAEVRFARLGIPSASLATRSNCFSCWSSHNSVLARVQVIKYYCPKLVDMHNYHKASNSTQKLANWNTLNTKVALAPAHHYIVPSEPLRRTRVQVLSKLDVKIPKAVLQNVIDLKPGVMLMVLSNIKIKVEQYIKPKIDRPDEEPVKKVKFS